VPEEKEHNDPKQYPEPEVPVDQAWRSMKDLLDAQLPAASAPRTATGFNGFGVIRLLVVLVAAVAFLWWLHTMLNKPENSSPSEQAVQQDTLQRHVEQAAPERRATPAGAPVKENTTVMADSDTLSGVPNKNPTPNTARSKAGEAESFVETDLQTKKTDDVSLLQATENNHISAGDPVSKKNQQQDRQSDNRRSTVENASRNHATAQKAGVGKATTNSGETGSSANTSGTGKTETRYRTKAAARSKPAAYGVLKKSSASDTTKSSEHTKAPELSLPTAGSGWRKNQANKEAVAKEQALYKRYTQAEGLNRKAGQQIDGFLNNGSRVSGIPKPFIDNAPGTVAARMRNRMFAGKRLGWGVQWMGAVPLPAAEHYFTGMNGKNRPHTSLIPGAWASMAFGKKHELLVQFIPYRVYFTGKQAIDVRTEQGSGPYAPFIVTTITYLNKTSSISGGLQYNYHFTTRWRIGAGLQYNRQRRALVHRQSVDSMGTVFSDSLIGLKQATSAPFLNASYSTGYGELSYGFKRFQLGGAVYVPLSTLSPAKPVRPFNSAVFLRWRFR
jgi:hypothetical protein